MRLLNIRARRRAISTLLVAFAGFTLVGCSHFSGKYSTTGDAAGAASVEFRSGSKAYLTVMDTTLETEYSTDGDKVTFKNVNGSNLVLTEEKDGTLTGPMGMVLHKQ